MELVHEKYTYLVWFCLLINLYVLIFLFLEEKIIDVEADELSLIPQEMTQLMLITAGG